MREEKISVKGLYQDCDWGWYDYQPMLDSFGNIVVQVDDEAYQGDSRVLYEKDGKIGLLVFGWGSCSGCDALQACNSLEEVQELYDELFDSIKWFDSRASAVEYFKGHDWKGDFSYGQETREFVRKSVLFLAPEEADQILKEMERW